MEEINKINEIRQANDIVEVISSYVPLTKRGKNYFGVCPFHNDTNPSMSVSEEKQIYKCFSCGASGNVYNFIMDYENIDFKEALNLLANRAGISIMANDVKKDTVDHRYYEAYSLALKYYQNNLNLKTGILAKEYLAKRDISEEAIKYFKIGLSSSLKDGLTKILLLKSYNIKELNDMGLCYEDKDLYQNRIMFPLYDLKGEVIGFSGRIYNTNSDSKYVNTRETKVFKKGMLLYNYHNAKEEARKAKNIIIVEGFMDVIRLHMIGINNVIALMGTSLTNDQISAIRKLSSNIYLSLDGDNPGIKATLGVGEELIKNNFVVKVINLRDGNDPDEYILKYGEEKYKSLISNAINFSDYKIELLKKDINLSSIEEKNKYINEVLNTIAKEKDEIKKELLIDKLSSDFNIDKDILKKRLQKDDKCSKIITFTKEVKSYKYNKYDKAAMAIIYYLLINEEAYKLYNKKINYLPKDIYRFLANEIVYYYKHIGKIEVSDFLTFLNDKKELLNLLKEILDQELNDNESMDVINEYFNVIIGFNKSQEVDRLKKMMREEPDLEKKTELAEKIRLIKIGS